MHILLIHQAFVAPHEAGGTRHYELAQHLAQAGHQVTVLASTVSYQTGKYSNPMPLPEEGATPGAIRVQRCYTYSALHRSYLHRLFAYWSFTASSFLAGLRTRRVDLVWGTSPPIFQAITALMLARLKRVPFLFEVRDLWPDFAVDLGVLRQPALIALSRQLERALYRSANRILINSPGFQPHLTHSGVPEGKVALVPNGVEAELFHPEERGAALRRAWGLEDRFIVLYAGAHGLANDLETLLGAAAILRAEPAIAFVLVGDGKEKANLQHRAAELGLDNVLFLPAQPKEQMPRVLAAADICVAILQPIARFATTYPNKVFDYMAAGRPTVLAIDGVIRREIEQADGGVFVPPGDARALAAAVRRLYRDPALRQRQGANARSYVVAHFAREQQARALERVLSDVIARRTRSWSPSRGKRALDLALTIPALIALSPVLGLVALLVRARLGSPVLFRQRRPGLRGRPFVLFKFRTMTNARDAQGRLLPDEERLTPLGLFLRRYSLDELPELWNVLRGEMSLVGPRPLLLRYLDRYTPEQARRHDVLPGITGWAQVNGRNALTWERKLELDVWYVDHCSLKLDLKILGLTLARVLRREGVVEEGSGPVAEFWGPQGPPPGVSPANPADENEPQFLGYGKG